MDSYPVTFSVDYPDRALNRLTTALRIFTIIPILIVFASIGGYGSGSNAAHHSSSTVIAVGGTGLLFLPPLLMIVFRQKYPRWWFDWNLELLRFTNRVGVYFALMDDRYPSTDDHQSVHLDFAYPDAQQGLNRWLPMVKWFLAIPHYVVLFFLYIGAIFAGDRRLVRDRLHRPLPARAVQLHRGRDPLAQPGRRLRLHPGHGRVPAVPTDRLNHHAVRRAAPIRPSPGRIGAAGLGPRFRPGP